MDLNDVKDEGVKDDGLKSSGGQLGEYGVGGRSAMEEAQLDFLWVRSGFRIIECAEGDDGRGNL